MKMKTGTTKKITEPSRSGSKFPIRRRDFLKYLGGGLVIILTPVAACRNISSQSGVLNELPDDFNAFLHIGEDGVVKCFTGKIEMGQGNMTALAQMMADELDVAFENI